MSFSAYIKHFRYLILDCFPVGNNITTAGAVLMHKLIRRSDGILSIVFNGSLDLLLLTRQSDNWRRTGFYRVCEVLGDVPYHPCDCTSILSVDTNADESFTHFVTALSKYNFNLRYLTIIQNRLSQTSIRLLFLSLTRIQIPTLQSFVMGFRILFHSCRGKHHGSRVSTTHGYQSVTCSKQFETPLTSEYCFRRILL